MEKTKPKDKKGLPLGIKAPSINIKDIFDEDVEITNILKEYDGVLVEFFRGPW